MIKFFAKIVKEPCIYDFHMEGGRLQIYHVFADSVVLNNRSIVHHCGWWRGIIVCGRHKCMTPND